MTDVEASFSRRAEYAETTRRAITQAARALFRDRGYFLTKVRDIADVARVAPATVYAVSGGKEQLLHAWVQEWLDSPAYAASLVRLEVLDDPVAIVELTAQTTGGLWTEWVDVIRVVVTTAPHDPAMAKVLKGATDQYVQGFANVVARLAAKGALRDGLDPSTAVDLFWFYFGFPAYLSLVEGRSWPVDRASATLASLARSALLSA